MLDVPVQACREALQANPESQFQGVITSGTCAAKLLIPSFQEKPLSFSCIGTVPQTDTGGQDENSKALERTRVKELGKLAP